MAWATVDSMQNSSDNRRSRTTASSGARIRWRTRTRAWRARIRQSPLYINRGVAGCRKFRFAGHFRTFSPVSGSGPGSVSDSRMTGWRYGREWFPGLGRSKCQRGAFSPQRAQRTRSFLGELPRPRSSARSLRLIRTPVIPAAARKTGEGLNDNEKALLPGHSRFQRRAL